MKNFWINVNPFNNKEVQNRWVYLVKTLLKFSIIYLVNILLIGLILFLIHIICGHDIFSKTFLKTENLEILVYYCHLISIILTLFFVVKIDKDDFSSLGLKKGELHKFLFGVAYSVGAVSIVIVVLLVFKQYKFEGLNPNRNIKKVFLSLGAFIIYALAEELLCRGLIENRLKEKFSIHICVFVSFIVFCIPHLIELFSYELKYSVVSILNLLFLSYIFSLLLDVYDNVYVCSGFHTAWNVLFYSVIGSNINGSILESSIFTFSAKNSLLNGGVYGIEYGIITSIVLLVFCIILSFVLKYLHKHTESKLLLIPKNIKKYKDK